MIQEDYHSHNPYHNAVHAADVTQAMYCYLQEPMVSCGAALGNSMNSPSHNCMFCTSNNCTDACVWFGSQLLNEDFLCVVVLLCMQLSKSLTSRDLLLGLLAAATHDLDHPGVNQPFLIKTDHYLATLYRVRTMDTHRWTVARRCFMNYSIYMPACLYFLRSCAEYLSFGKPPLEVGSGPAERDRPALPPAHRGEVSLTRVCS